MHKTKSGFTIVELLIVIVVIGILAAITVVSYNSVQQRANNTRRIAAAKDWQKLIVAYTAQNGAYPATTLNNHSCLGTGYPTDFDTNADEDCFTTGNIKHPYPSINSAYATIAKLPQYPPDKLDSNNGPGGITAGISLRAYDTLDPSGSSPKTTYPFLHYWLAGNNQDCVLRPVAQPVSGGYTASAFSYTSNVGPLTYCVIILPDPGVL